MSTSLQFKYVLEAGADSSRLGLLNTDQNVQLDYTPDQELNIYVNVADLNNVFSSSEFAGTYLDLSGGGTGQDYIDMINAQAQNVSGQPLDFTFDWDLLSAGAKNDLSDVQHNVWRPVGVLADSTNTHTFDSTDSPGNPQSVPTILQLAGQGAPGKTASAFMGTVFNNQSAAILNMADFSVPSLTVSEVLTEVLPTINGVDVRPYREELFIQAYNSYKYDLSYQRLALTEGDKISVPVRFQVNQEVNYDLSGSAIDGGDGPLGKEHTNSMLTFVVENGSSSQEFSVMKKESVSKTVNYMLHFIAVGAGPEVTA